MKKIAIGVYLLMSLVLTACSNPKEEKQIEVLPEGALQEEREEKVSTQQILAGIGENDQGMHWATIIKTETQVDIVFGMNVLDEGSYIIEITGDPGGVIFDGYNSYVLKGDVSNETLFATDEEGHLLIKSTHPARIFEQSDQMTIRIFEEDGEEVIFELVLEEI